MGPSPARCHGVQARGALLAGRSGRRRLPRTCGGREGPKANETGSLTRPDAVARRGLGRELWRFQKGILSPVCVLWDPQFGTCILTPESHNPPPPLGHQVSHADYFRG